MEFLFSVAVFIFFIAIMVIPDMYENRDGAFSIIVLNKNVSNDLTIHDELNFLLIYKNKKEINVTNSIALIDNIDKCISGIKITSSSSYDIRVNYKATIASFNDKAISFLPKIKNIIEKEHERYQNNNNQLINQYKG